MKIGIEKIETAQSCIVTKSALEHITSILLRPKVGNESLGAMHDALSAHYSTLNRRTAIRAEMLVILWLYAPQMLVRNRRSPRMREIASVIGLKDNNAYAYRKNLLFAYKTYADFRQLVDEGIGIALDAAREKEAV